ncbi:hypothetical protein OEZ85_012893 [Tetradesmus obliquus]|uniref:GPI transamidase component PIG-S n=1 Tax=Tetradesmus obliquus TaxID=3088 RepID=A0ABY8U3Z7_TETOB|nr:hypothetical protein OEZ85_012893 [Tetradesmus obliquus]
MANSSRPPGTKRLWVISSIVAYVVFAGVPIWWATTSLHRPPLPHEAIAAAEADAGNRSALLPVALQLVLVVPAGSELPDDLQADRMLAAVQAAVAGAQPVQGPLQLSITLNAAGRCSQQLPNLEMPDLIGQQVEQALSDIHSAWQHIAAGDYHAAGAAAAAARAAAEAAFLHPSVLAQLNFPDSHKLGVYMPLFLPVSVPLLQGFVLQLRHYVKRRREYTAALRAGG